MNSQTPTARLVKSIRRNETVRVSNAIKHNGEFTKSPQETLSYLFDILSPGSQQRWSPRGRTWSRGRLRGHILKSLTLASKPQVLGLGLEALHPRKLPCPRLEDSSIF